MDKGARIFVAGHRGLVGSSIISCLKKEGYHNLVLRTSKELDLRRQADVEAFFKEERPEYVFVAAAKVGGILANSTYPAEFIYDNLMIEANVIHSSYLSGVRKLLFLGSSCIYPKFAPQPIKEEHLLTGSLEPTNEAYALAKITGIGLCRHYRSQYGCDFISAMPTNLYGPNDNFDLSSSHVIPALIRKVHEAKVSGKDSMVIWGSGKPRREFLYVDDLADACVFLMNRYTGESHINVGTGKDVEIRELAEIISEVVGFRGRIDLDTSKPDGTPKKLLDVQRIEQMGWRAKTDLRKGLELTYKWYVSSLERS